MYRRPRVAANLKYIAQPAGVTLMADGREASLRSQAITAAITHEQASVPPTPAQLKQIEDFERQLFMAQDSDYLGGLLGEPGGLPLLGVENVVRGVASLDAVAAAGNLAASFDAWRHLFAPNLAIRQRDFRESVLRAVDLFASRRFRLPNGSILMQQFRGIIARAPYFANGSAGDLTELVDFYD